MSTKQLLGSIDKPSSSHMEAVCRGCLSSDILEATLLNNRQWRTRYNYCLGLDIKLKLSDEPQYLCQECADMILKFSEFKKKCIKADKAYNSLLNTGWKPSIPKVEEKIGIKQEPPESIDVDDHHDSDLSPYLVIVEPKKCDAEFEKQSKKLLKNLKVTLPKDLKVTLPKTINEENQSLDEAITGEESQFDDCFIHDDDDIDADFIKKIQQKTKPNINNEKHLKDLDVILPKENSKENHNVDETTPEEEAQFDKYLMNDVEIDPDIVTKIKIKLESNKNRHIVKCDKCKSTFKNKRLLMRHGSTNLCLKKRPSTYCGLCDQTLSTVDILSDHLRDHFKENKLLCDNCNFTGRDFADMVAHRQMHLPETSRRKYICFECDTKLAIRSSLEYHFRSVHLNKNGGLCSVCNKSFKNKTKWMKHERFHKAEGFWCDHCGKKFPYKGDLIIHWRDISDIRPYICEVCGLGFKRGRNLKSHFDNVHSERQKIKCHHCEKFYTNMHSLKIHLKRETAEKNYHCQVCSKGFVYRKNYELHMFFHTGERPFVCEVCGKGFKTKSSLVGHNRRHTGDRPHKCSSCDSAFGTRRQLTIHESIHTGIRLYTCTMCPRSFNSRILLRQHCNSRHPNLVKSF